MEEIEKTPNIASVETVRILTLRSMPTLLYYYYYHYKRKKPKDTRHFQRKKENIVN